MHLALLAFLAVSAPETSYPSELWHKAWTDSLDWLGGGGGMVATLIVFGLTFFASWRKEGRTAARQFLVSGIKGAGVVVAAWILILVMHLCVISPAALNTEKQAAIDSLKDAQKAATPAPIRIDVLDTEGRKKIEELQSELVKTKEALQNAITTGQSNPLDNPIASARFSAVINFKSRKEELATHMSGAIIYLGREGSDKKGAAMLHGGTSLRSSDGHGHSRLIIDCPFDAPYMGKPIRTLTEASFIQVEFADDFVPIDTELDAGRIVLVLNNQVTLSFEIPAQVVKEKLNGKPGFVVNDIQNGLKPLLTPP